MAKRALRFRILNRTARMCFCVACTAFCSEWLSKHPADPELASVAKLFDTQRHFVVTRLRLRAIGPEQPIPPGQIEAKIAVRFALHDGVVNAMHVGRDNQPAQ